MNNITTKSAKAEAQYANAPAAVTANKTTSMTKEERYAKKMAKYEANRAKKEQRAKEQAEKLMNEIWDLMLHNDKSGTCSLTGVHYDNYGNNAYPFDGRCSDWANTQYVIPARMMGFTPEMIQMEGKEVIMNKIDSLHNEGQFKPNPVSLTITAGR